MPQNNTPEGIQSRSMNSDRLAQLHDTARQQAHQLRREAITQWSDSLLSSLAGVARRLTSWR
jgi:hypothetical protein